MAKRKRKRYRATRDIRWGDKPFRLEKGQKFTKADLLPGMAAALRKWLRVGAAVEVKEKQVAKKKQEV